MGMNFLEILIPSLLMVLFFKMDLIIDSVFSSLAFAKRNALSSVLETLEYAFFISV